MNTAVLCLISAMLLYTINQGTNRELAFWAGNVKWNVQILMKPRDAPTQKIGIEGYLFPLNSHNCPTTKAIHCDNRAVFIGWLRLLLWSCGWLLYKSQCARITTVRTLDVPFLIWHVLMTLPEIYGTLRYKKPTWKCQIKSWQSCDNKTRGKKGVMREKSPLVWHATPTPSFTRFGSIYP